MIKSWKNKGLKELFERGVTSRIDKKFHARIIERLDVVNRATDTRQLDLPGYAAHPLHQFKPLRWSISVNGPWRITFEWDKGDAYRVDFEQYH